MMKFREAIAKQDYEASLDKHWEAASEEEKEGFVISASLILQYAFSARIEGCRLAIVKDCEMPRMLDGEGTEKGAMQYRREMGANIVQEVLDEQTDKR